MGKGTDKLFITHSEWAQGSHSSSGGKVSSATRLSRSVASLPFWTCSISQQPIDKDCGVCDSAGHVFDIKNILPFILRKKINPVTNETLSSPSELIKLKLTKNDSGDYIDPVTFKVFQPLSEVVVLKVTGNVYLLETIKEMCLKSGKLVDLVTEKPFTKEDIIHLVGGVGVLKKSEDDIQREQKESKSHESQIVKKRTRDQAEMNMKASSSATSGNSLSSKKSVLTTHHLASSVTSTISGANTVSYNTDIPLERLLIPKRYNEPGFAVIDTNLGQMTIELYAKYSPKAVYNFVTHAKSGYYNGVAFHRNIRSFMIQGGDPTGTGMGGESVFDGGKPFKDETNSPYKIDSRGILAMANKGKNTNGSQFFITYRRAPHLDGKHTVFAKVVKGLEVVDKMERAEVDQQDRPKKKIFIEEIRILQDPFEEKEEDDQKLLENNENKEQEDDSPWLKRTKLDGSGSVGRYLSEKLTSNKTKEPASNGNVSGMLVLPAVSNDDSKWKQRRKNKTSLKNSSFSGW